MTNLGEFAKEVHRNAVEHGWWETERPFGEVAALIHSEWSEALEEYRAGRQLVWYACKEGNDEHPCTLKDEYDCLNFNDMEHCEHRGKKPEGIAVELIDGVIRILDFIGYVGAEDKVLTETIDETISYIDSEMRYYCADDDFPVFIARLHNVISAASVASFAGERNEYLVYGITEAVAMVLWWVKSKGLDPEAIMIAKHEYNKSRPYKHGKKC